jgi:DNA sulfur modification protein DndC
LGVRKGESVERDKTIKRHETHQKYYLRQSTNRNVRIFSPIIDYNVKDVWATIGSGSVPRSIRSTNLAILYWKASGECPIIRDPKGTPCGSGRFGCWTCTVVRRDHAVENLVAAGYPELKPLLAFRNWLAEVRDLPAFRCSRRRNGTIGLGPFTLKARRQILKRLLIAQSQACLELIRNDELRIIRSLWKQDMLSAVYRE